MINRTKVLVLALVMMLGVSALAGAQTITIGNVLWDSSVAQTSIIQAIIEDELGYEVDVLEVDAGPMLPSPSGIRFISMLISAPARRIGMCQWLLDSRVNS